jgi:hypothetical protein
MHYLLPLIVQYGLPSIGLLAFLLFLTATLVDGRRHPTWQHRAEALLGLSGTLFCVLVLVHNHARTPLYLDPLSLVRAFLAGASVGIFLTLWLEGSYKPWKKRTKTNS